MARRSDHTREELKELIIQSTWDIVADQGIKGLSARKIADSIGYAPGTIYNIFTSMDDLIVHLNTKTLNVLYDQIEPALTQSDNQSPEDIILKISEIYMQFARDYAPYWSLIFEHKFEEGYKPESWYQEKIDGLFSTVEQVLQPYFKEGGATKRQMAARILWSSLHGLCALYQSGKIDFIESSEASEQDMREYLIKSLIKGIS